MKVVFFIWITCLGSFIDGKSADNLPFWDAFEPDMLPPIHLENYHLIGGNDSRFVEFKELKLDSKWQKKM